MQSKYQALVCMPKSITGETRVFFFAFFSFSFGFRYLPRVFFFAYGVSLYEKTNTATGLLDGRGRTPRPVLLLALCLPWCA